MVKYEKHQKYYISIVSNNHNIYSNSITSVAIVNDDGIVTAVNTGEVKISCEIGNTTISRILIIND